MYEGSNMIIKYNTNCKISLLHLKQIPELHIHGAYVSALVILVLKDIPEVL